MARNREAEEISGDFAAFRAKVRQAIWPYAPNNPLVSDQWLIDRIDELVNARADAESARRECERLRGLMRDVQILVSQRIVSQEDINAIIDLAEAALREKEGRDG